MSQVAILYARFSSAIQATGYSLERQHTLGREFAQVKGWTVEKLIADEGRSAFHGANRLEGADLHEFELEARNGLHTGKVLIVENIDRLSRQGAKAAAQLIWGLNENGVDVATYHDEHVYKATTNGDMLDIFKLVILAQQSHEESKTKSKRATATWEKRFKQIQEGQIAEALLPHTPLWIDKTETGYRLNEHRVKVLNEIYDLYIDGVGIHRIVCILNERDEQPWTPREHARAKNGWFYSYIFRLLTKRTVLGDYVTLKGEVLATGVYPQAITAEKWNRAQAALAMRKGNQSTKKVFANRNLLSKIVVCDVCNGGAHFGHTTDYRQTYTKVSGEVVHYKRKTYRRMRCDRARRNHSCENGTVINYDVIEATVLNEMLPRMIDRGKETATLKALRQQVAELVRLRDTDQTRMDNLVDALADGGSKAIVQRVAMLEKDIEQRTAEIDKLQKAIAIEDSKPRETEDVEAIESLRAELTDDDLDIRTYARGRVNMSLRRLIKQIAITDRGTFRVDMPAGDWWLFKDDGELIEGAYSPAEALTG